MDIPNKKSIIYTEDEEDKITLMKKIAPGEERFKSYDSVQEAELISKGKKVRPSSRYLKKNS